MAKKNKPPHLSNRDRSILEFVGRYRAATPDLLQRSCFRRRDSDANVRRVLARLVKHRLLAEHGVGTSAKYYTPTRRGLSETSFPSRTPRKLTEQTLPELLAVAEYCTAKKFRKFTPTEFALLFAELWWSGSRSSVYIPRRVAGKLHLQLLLIDRGGADRRITSRVRRVIAQRSRLPKFRVFIRSGRFEIVVLTGLVNQQTRIDRQLHRNSFGAVSVSTALMPSLGNSLTLER